MAALPFLPLFLHLLLTMLGGHAALILTAPITALTEVHSFAGALAILNGLSGPQRVEIAKLLISNQPDWLKKKERRLLIKIIEQELKPQDTRFECLPTGTPMGMGGTFTGWRACP